EFPETAAYTYVYDAFHRRIERQAWKWHQGNRSWKLKETEKFVYDGFKEIGKADAEGNLVELRVLGTCHRAESGAAVALELQGHVYLPIHDIQGSIRCLVDADSGKVAESYAYTVFGEESLWDENDEPLQRSLIGNPWRFCSKRKDEATNLIFFGKRD